MTLFDSLGKPGWEHSDPEVRKAAIDELDDQDQLLELARNDPETGVRSHALARISEPGLLDQLSESLSGELQKQARAQRLAQLLPDPGRLDSISDPELLVRIASLSEDPELIARAIGQVSDPAELMELAVNHPVARIRLCAAQGIEDIDQLHELMNRAKHKDKSVFRHCKSVLDEHHAVERARAEREARIEQLAEDASSLAQGVDSPEYKARFQTLSMRWQELQEHAGEKRRRAIQTDLDICAKRIELLDSARESEQLQMERAEQARETFRVIITELETLDIADIALREAAEIKAFEQELDRSEDRWVAATLQVQPEPEQFRTCKKHLKYWRTIARSSQQVLDLQPSLEAFREACEHADRLDFLTLNKLAGKAEKLARKLAWPESVESHTPDSIRELHERRAGLLELIRELQGKQDKTLEQLETGFAELRKELDDNHFRNADRVLDRVRNLIRRLEPKRQAHYQDELKPLIARLKEIHDWQGFAIEPKKVELCERMAALVGADENPDVLAAKIKALQEEWKKLGPLTPRRDQALWKKFRAAADEAYKPCKQAFSQQAAMRRENFQQRMLLVQQLVEYEEKMAWPDTRDGPAVAVDWKKVQQTLDTARDAFRTLKPVDHKGERKSRKALNAVCDRIYGHIRTEYERNIQRKEDLVGQARELVELEDLREAIEKAKGLQREWKEVGVTPRKVDRRLWKDFRKACDAIFARLDARRDERNAEARERARMKEERKRRERQRWPNLQDRLRACALKPVDAEQALALWEKEGEIPKGIDGDALENYWQEGPAENPLEEALRTACIAFEILHDVESPPSDKEARMAFQMQRLVEGMGTLQVGRNQQALDAINGFIALRPPADWMERFCSGGKITGLD